MINNLKTNTCLIKCNYSYELKFSIDNVKDYFFKTLFPKVITIHIIDIRNLGILAVSWEYDPSSPPSPKT